MKKFQEQKQAFGQRLRWLRGERTQTEFKDLVGLGQGTISELETGEANPTMDIIFRIFNSTNCSISWLLTGEGPPFPSASEFVVRETPPKTLEPIRIAYPPVSLRVLAQLSAGAEPGWEPLEHEYIELPRNSALAQVYDDSAMPFAWPGQYLIIVPNARIENGDLAVLKLRRRGYVFRETHFHEDMVNLISIHRSRRIEPLLVPISDIMERWLVYGLLTPKIVPVRG